MGLPAHAGVGTEGASFLNIPVGAGPAALGGAYTALADDVYAPTFNPGGLGAVQSNQFSAQHLSYLDSNHYEYFSFVHPMDRSPSCSAQSFCPSGSLGGSIQYFGSGDMTATNTSGQATGSFSSHFAAYNLSYGHTVGQKLSLGITGKLINAKIDDVSANAYAVDLGSMYKVRENLTLAATLTNLGTKLTFLSEGDSLPLSAHFGAAYRPNNSLQLTAEGIYRKTGLASGHAGVEWRPMPMIALRGGYRTDTTKGLSPMAGLTTGIGLEVWGQELSYAWLPLGELGNTQYLSLLVRFGEADRQRRNLIYLRHDRKGEVVDNTTEMIERQQLMELFDHDPEPYAQAPGSQTQPDSQK